MSYYKLVKMLLVLLTVCNMVFAQSDIITSDQSAREGDAEVVIPCDYSEFTNNPGTIDWNEVNEVGANINESFVNDKITVRGRHSLRLVSGSADLIISKPVRADSQRRFQCRIRSDKGITRTSDTSVLTVYYIDHPVLKHPTVIINEGDPVTLTCIIPDGKPVPYVKWYKDGKALSKNVKTNGVMSVFSIKKSSLGDQGKYTCKAESDQFEGKDGKTSDAYQLILNYILLNFEFEDNIATCTAEGHPKPINVTIMKNREVIMNGENTAMVEITDEMCNSNLTCSAGNGELTKFEEVKNCGEQRTGSRSPVFVVIIVVLLIVMWFSILIYYIIYKKIEWESGDDIKSVEEGDDAITMTWRYRPSVAWFKSFQVYKNDERGSAQKQFSSSKSFFMYILYCSVYLCGFVCCEYSSKKKYAENPVKRNRVQEMGEHGNGDGQASDVQKEANPSGGVKSSLLADSPSTEAKYQVKRLDSIYTNGRGEINFELAEPIKRSVSGNYKCQIQCRRPYEQTKALMVNWLKMECTKYQSEEDYAFEMKCRFGSPNMALKNYKWKKNRIDANGKSLIIDLSKDSNFEVSKDEGSCTLTVRILKVKLSDAGTYQCSVGKKLTATTHLDVMKAPFRMHIEDATEYHGAENAKVVLLLSDQDQSAEILNITWYKEVNGKKHLMASTSLKGPNKTSRYQASSAKNSRANLVIKDVIPDDAGKYICDVEVRERQRSYSCSGFLKVKDRLFHMENKASIVGEDVKIWYRLTPNAPPTEKFIFYKKTNSGTWKALASSDDIFKSNFFGKKYETHYDSVRKDGFLLIPKIKAEDAGTYRCQCVIDKNNYYATCELQVDKKENIKINDVSAMESQNAVIVCMYVIEDLKAVKWYKQTSDGKQSLISSAEKNEINDKKETTKRFTIEYSDHATRFEIKNVTGNDSGTYICQLETMIKKSKIKELSTASAELWVPWTIFAKKSGRHPAIVFMNSHFLVFCERKGSAVVRRGKLTITNSIDWEEPKTILKEKNASFQNMVPIVVNEEKGHAILMCVRQSTKQKKIIIIKTDDSGENWSKRNDVELKMENFLTDSLNKFYIGPGHGVCLQSGGLVVSGISEVEPNRNVLFLLTSEDAGKTWDVLLAPNPPNASLGTYSQIAEYANDRVCISCSLEDSKQRFHVFSTEGCKTFEETILDDALIEANPGCQAGIVSVPMKSDAKYNLIAFTNPSSSERFENLTVHLSEDGCKTWTKFRELGSAYTKGSDLAYYEIKNENKISRGIACVYETFSNEEDCSIVMQLVSLEKRK